MQESPLWDVFWQSHLPHLCKDQGPVLNQAPKQCHSLTSFGSSYLQLGSVASMAKCRQLKTDLKMSQHLSRMNPTVS